MRSQENTFNQVGRLVRLMLTLAGLALMLSAAAQAATFHVSNTDDHGPGSLRDAIMQSNAVDAAGANLIDFQIQPAGGVKTISLQSELPFITAPVIIDGTTQSGYAGQPIIELDGSNAGNDATGLIIDAGDSTVKGLIINRFSKYGIVLRTNGNNVIAGNYIGLDSTGTLSLPIGGVSLYIGTAGNVIGGTAPAERNVISGVQNAGIYFGEANATGNQVKGNYIGTDATGNAQIGNSTGIVFDNAPGNTVGGTTPAERNVISGNGDGISFNGSGSTGNVVKGNYIGTKTDGASKLAGGFHGCYLFAGAHGNTIGGTQPGEGNVIAYQSGGVVLGSGTGSGNSIRGNSIFSSGQMAIDLGEDGPTANESGDGDQGPNDLLNYPVITAAVAANGNLSITGTLSSTANKQFSIDLYSSPTPSILDPPEAKKYLATVSATTDGNGNAGFSTSVPVGSLAGLLVTATATDENNSTSELSPAAQVTGLSGDLQFSAPAYSVNSGQALVAVTRTGGTTGSVSVHYATSDGTAKQGTDYDAQAGTLFWADGDAQPKTFAVPTSNISSTDKTVNLALSNPQGGAALGPQATAVLTIKAAPPNGDLQFSAPAYSVNEDGGQATITVTRTNGASGAVTVSYATGDGAAKQPGDYTTRSGLLSWADGDASSKSFNVPVIDDLIYDPDETINLTLSAPTGGAKLGPQATAVLTIVDNEQPPDPADLVVKNTNDSGPGSLRQAILTANSLPGTDTITFNIQPADAYTITPLTALPVITDPVIIDATTQPGFAGTPVIELSGAGAGQNLVSGLSVKAGPSTIKGFVINRFSGAGIFLLSANNTVAGNFIGTDITGNKSSNGNVSLANNPGIGISANNNLIGGTAPTARNIISGNQIGIDVCCQGIKSGNKIVGNYIGTNVDGTAALPNISEGIRLDDAPNTVVGGTTPAERNVISGNPKGILLSDNVTGTIVQGNYLGTKADGVNALGNTINAIYSSYNVTDATIGGTANGAGNVIAFNGKGNAGDGGIAIPKTPPGGFKQSRGMTITGNSIFSNNGLGIDLGNDGVTVNDTGDGDSGSNDFQNYPVLTSVTTNGSSIVVQGTLNSEASKTYRVELFSGDVCSSTGFGQGQFFIAAADVTTDAGGNAGFTFTVPTASVTGTVFTATATNPGKSTSEFSACASAAPANPGALQFSASGYEVKENAGSVTVTVTRTGGTTGTVSVDYATSSDGSKFAATPPVDYITTSGTLTFLDGETSKSFSVSISDDSVSEGTEIFFVNLSNQQGGATLGAQSKSQVSIDDDDTPSMSIGDVKVIEGDSGATDAVFTVSLERPYFAVAQVDFVTLDGTATAGSDYQSASGTLIFNPGETSKTITVKVNGDTVQEPDETFSVNLSNNMLALSKSKGTGTILNDDAAKPASTVQFEQLSYTVSEGDHYKSINITRTGDTSADAFVDYATADGTAQQRTDYNTLLGTLHFAPGESVKSLTLLVTEDSYVEGDETLTINLSNPVGMTLGAQSQALVTITDNDSDPNAQNAIVDVPTFVRQQYHDFLNREPDPVGFQGWQDILNNCAPNDTSCDRIAVSSAFYRSQEFHDRGYFIYRFYAAALGRVPHYEEFVRDMQKVSGFLSDQEKEQAKVDFINEFMGRGEFQQKYDQVADVGAYVDALSASAGVTLSNRDQLVQQLQANQITRGQALRAVAESSEVDQMFYDEAFVIMQYFGYLRRDADILYLQWIQTLKQTKDYRVMVNGFMNSTEYVLRFGK